MKIKGNELVIIVPNLEEAIEYYKNALDFQMDWDYRDPQTKELTFASLSSKNEGNMYTIFLQPEYKFETTYKTKLKKGNNIIHSIHPCCESIDEVYSKMIKHMNILVELSPTEFSENHYYAVLEDKYGHIWHLMDDVEM